MSGQPSSPERGPKQSNDKVCSVCGVDCSKSQRTKDASGKYMCADCVARAEQAQRVLKDPPKAVKPAAKSSDGKSGNPGDSNTFLLTLGTNAQALSGGKPCPNCERVLNRNDTVCLGCGFHIGTNKTVRTRVEGGASAGKVGQLKEPKVIGAIAGGVVVVALIAWYLMGTPGL